MTKKSIPDLRYRLWTVIAALIFTLGVGVTIILSCLRRHSTEEMILSEGSIDDAWGGRRLLDEVRSKNGVDEIFALHKGDSYYPSYLKAKVVRIQGERAIYSIYVDKFRELYAELPISELEKLRSFIRKNSIDYLDQVDEGDCGSHKCKSYYTYLHLTRDSSRIVKISLGGQGDNTEKPYRQLIDLFFQPRHGELEARYHIGDKIKGLEVLYTGGTNRVLGVCKSGRGIGVLVKNQKLEEEWRDFTEWRNLIKGIPDNNNMKPSTPCRRLSDSQILDAKHKRHLISPEGFPSTPPTQPTGRPNEFWTAIFDRDYFRPTKIGRYNTRKFVFTPLIELPLSLPHSEQLWVDEAEDKIYLVYEGDLLRLPLKQ